jgi:hypothetical protein
MTATPAVTPYVSGGNTDMLVIYSRASPGHLSTYIASGKPDVLVVLAAV